MSTSSTHYISLGDKRAGVIAVASSATLSIFSILLLLLYSSYLIYSHYKLSPNERLGDRSRGIAFLTSNHGLFFLSLIAGDLLQGIGFAINWNWVAKTGLPSPINRTCTAQAVFIQMGDLASAFSSLAIATFVFSIFVLHYTPSNKFVYSSIVFLWLVVGLLTGIGPATLGASRHPSGEPFYGQAGGWCWISQSHQIYRLWLHYLFVFLVAGINLILYSIIAIQIFWRRRRVVVHHQRHSIPSPPTLKEVVLDPLSVEPNKEIAITGGTSHSRKSVGAATKAGIGGVALGGSAKVALIMMIYPVVYLITILPISIYRLALLNGQKPSIQYALGAGFIFTMSGTFNCLVYASTRKIVSFPGKSTFRKRSTADRGTAGGTAAAAGAGGGSESIQFQGYSLGGSGALPTTLRNASDQYSMSERPGLGGRKHSSSSQAYGNQAAAARKNSLAARSSIGARSYSIGRTRQSMSVAEQIEYDLDPTFDDERHPDDREEEEEQGRDSGLSTLVHLPTSNRVESNDSDSTEKRRSETELGRGDRRRSSAGTHTTLVIDEEEDDDDDDDERTEY